MSQLAAPIRVGLVGAGPWASLFHAPMFAASPATTLAGVWARRPEMAEEVAIAHQTTSFTSFQEMLEHVDALSFAVPPDVQAEMAITGARAGKALLLEKPITLDLGRAIEMVEVIDETGVPTQLLLTWRYADTVRDFLDAIRSCEPLGGRGHFVSGGLLGGMFATPWRIEQGPLFDFGPHVLDLLDAALGPIREISAHGDLHRWIGLTLIHESGTVSQASLTAYSRVDPARAGVEVYGAEGVREVDTADLSARAAPTIASEFAAAVRTGRPHALDVHRGLHLQRLLAAAARDIS
ncbi:MAG: Gfo/Idh/MocA family protein [Acidimicrobiales bacterium]